MTRTLSIGNIYQMKFRTMPFAGIWAEPFGQPEYNGVWLIYGMDKNGKTWFALKLFEYLGTFDKALYVSAEEGISKAIQDTVNRIGMVPSSRLQMIGYISIDELEEVISRRKSARIIFLDNCTVYTDELSKSRLLDLIARYPHKLFIFLAHEERNIPYTSIARLIKKLAKVIVHVKGLTCQIYGRCPGGILTIDEVKSRLYWGNNITES